MKTKFSHINILVSLILILSAQNRLFADDLEVKILKLSKEAIHTVLDESVFELYLEKKWFPSQLNSISSESIVSVNVIGNIKTYSNLSVLFLDQNQTPIEKQIQVKITGRMRVYTAKKDIQRGTIIEAEHLNESWISLGSNFEKNWIQLNQLIGSETQNTIKAGRVIHLHNVKKPVLIINYSSPEIENTVLNQRFDLVMEKNSCMSIIDLNWNLSENNFYNTCLLYTSPSPRD